MSNPQLVDDLLAGDFLALRLARKSTQRAGPEMIFPHLDDDLLAADLLAALRFQQLASRDDGAPPCSGLAAPGAVQVHRLPGHHRW